MKCIDAMWRDQRRKNNNSVGAVAQVVAVDVGIAVGIWRVSLTLEVVRDEMLKANYILTNTLDVLDVCSDMKLANQQ